MYKHTYTELTLYGLSTIAADQIILSRPSTISAEYCIQNGISLFQ